MYTKFLQLFLLMGVGFGANRLNIITPNAYPALNRLISFIAMPCVVFASILKLELTSATLLSYIELTVVQILFFFVTLLPLLWVTKRNFGLTETERDGILPAVRVAGTIPNNGFLGFPIALLLLGSEGLFYMIALNNAMNVILFSYADMQYLPKEERAAVPIGRAVRKAVLHPVSLAAVLAVLVVASGLTLPTLLFETIDSIGNMSSPLAMLYIGAILSSAGAALERKERAPLAVAITSKLFLCPLLALPVSLLLFRMGIWNDIASKSFVLGSALPTVAYSLVFAEEHHANARFAGWAIVSSTILSIATIPLWDTILTRVIV